MRTKLYRKAPSVLALSRHVANRITAILIAVMIPCLQLQANDDRDHQVDFVSEVKPILSDNCFACHGPDESQRTSDFRLDQKDSALSEEYSVIVPGNVDASELAQRILSTDADTVMPPSDHRKRLSDAQKKDPRPMDPTRCPLVRALVVCSARRQRNPAAAD